MIIPYIHFSEAIIRTPSFPYNATNEEVTSSPLFKEAIYIASPELSHVWDKGLIKEGKKHTLLKYAIRAKSRCTPFGLFSACSSVPVVREETKIKFDSEKDCGRLRLDYCTIGRLSKKNTIDFVDYNTQIYLNGSAYIVGSELRLIGYTIDKDCRLSYCLNSFEIDETLSQVIGLLRSKATLAVLLNYLTKHNYSQEEAISYLKDLITDSVIVFAGDLSIVTDNNKKIETELTKVENNLSSNLIVAFDKDRLDVIKKVVSVIKQKMPYIHDNQIIQVDMLRKLSSSSCVSSATVNDCIKLIPSLLYYFGNLCYNRKRLSLFKDKFRERFDRKTVPLLFALDPDVGIGYDASYSLSESPLLKGLSFGNKKEQQSVEKVQSYLNLKDSRSEIVLPMINDEVINDIDWSELPDTMAIFCSLYKDQDGKIKTYLKNIGGVSAINTISRFAYLSEELLRLVKEIASHEQQHNQHSAKLASINILPNLKAGNVSRHPPFRESTISIINNGEESIQLNQLVVKIENNRLILIDQKDGKRVIPCIDNALVYDRTHFSVYKFLCDLQAQDMIYAVFNPTYFNNGTMVYIPRIVLGNIIIHRAEWHFTYSDLLSSEEVFYENLLKSGVSPQCVIIESDNELRINLDHKEELNIAYCILRRQKQIILCEDLLSIYPQPIIEDMQGNPYSNEFVIPIHK